MPARNPSTLALLLAAGLGLVAAAFPSRAEDDRPRPAAERLASSSPEARERFEALVAAYRALPAYRDRGAVEILTRVGDKVVKRTEKAQIRFEKPNKLDVEADLVRLVSDGSTAYEVNLPLKTYRKVEMPAPFREAGFRGGAIGSIEFGGVAGLPLAHVLNLVVGHQPERLVEDFAPRLIVEPDRQSDGVAYKVLRLDEADNHDWRFLIDPKTGLIAVVELAIEPKGEASPIPGFVAKVESIRWSAGKVETDLAPVDAFRYQPAEGFKLVEPLDHKPPEK